MRLKHYLKYIIYSLIAISIVGTGTFYLWQYVKPAEPPHKITKINLLTIGDSLTEGVGDQQHEQGYSGRITKELKSHYHLPVKTTNFGKAGDRSDQIRSRVLAQKNIQRKISQSNIIVLTVGGNDLQQVLLKNATVKTPQALTASVNSSTKTYTRHLQQLLTTVRSFNADAPIFIFGNYNPVYVYFANRADLNQDVKLYNNINQQSTRQVKKAYYVDIFDLTYGQYTTSKLRKELTNTSAISMQTLLSDTHSDVHNDYISDDDHYHPNSRGYDYMTRQLLQRIKQKEIVWINQR